MLIDSETAQRKNISSHNLGKRFRTKKVNSSLRTAKGVAESRLLFLKLPIFSLIEKIILRTPDNLHLFLLKIPVKLGHNGFKAAMSLYMYKINYLAPAHLQTS